MKRVLLLPVLFLLVLFASLTPAAIYGDKATWLATPEQLSSLPVGTEFADINGQVLSGGPYEGTIFNGCYLILTRNGLDLVFTGILVCPQLYPNGTPCFYPGPGPDSTIYTWQYILAPQDPLPQATNEQLFQSIDIRGLYAVIIQQGQGLVMRKLTAPVPASGQATKPLAKVAPVVSTFKAAKAPAKK